MDSVGPLIDPDVCSLTLTLDQANGLVYDVRGTGSMLNAEGRSFNRLKKAKKSKLYWCEK